MAGEDDDEEGAVDLPSDAGKAGEPKYFTEGGLESTSSVLAMRRGEGASFCMPVSIAIKSAKTCTSR